MVEVSFQGQNIMYVNGSYMNLGRDNATRNSFSGLVRIAKPLIVDQLELLYDITKLINPDAEVNIGSIWLGRLAIKNIDSVLTKSGMYRKYETQQDRGVYVDPADFLTTSFIHQYWTAVSENGLQPEARQGGGGRIKTGLHLLATVENKLSQNRMQE